ncbi:TraM recognition domain-containing protein [Curtobacterium sp. MCLR17_054]|uniref:type IV secretory system conjugative DNA transfer family protein n=1 Tax=Curtobacterium sp. MCLR17_054 TaxID=2175632 RepID=UPI000DA9EE1F|nr:TraM recognition domain-containing protein [Curtobacterium sp. MCLR17_054]WIE70274.1 TraM recognition domain-containing protein [Curtobacterium sp. MCLR17_054]
MSVSTRQPNRRPQPGNEMGPTIGLACAAGGTVGLGLLAWAGSLVNPSVQAMPNHGPSQVLTGYLGGDLDVTVPQVLVTGILLGAGAGIVGYSVWMFRGFTKQGTRIDGKAQYMAGRDEAIEFYEAAATVDSERLRATGAGIGVTLGTHVNTKEKLYASWEWVQIWLMGPRAGKTSCVCVPQILETRGPVIATSNKRDIVDITRGPRSETGVVWVHDVQDIIGEAPSWWWNPLTFVRDIQTAEKLADIFITSSTSAGAKQDAYFESAGKETLSRLLLAAALDERPITDVFKWANNPDDEDDPALLLIQHGEAHLGEALGSTQGLTPKQRDGVYGTLRPWIGVLGMRSVARWITDNGTDRPHLNTEAFVTSTDTMYLISKEGGGSARAITGALTMALLEAAERVGSRQVGGRLTTPLMAVLDEVANVCRWRELPDVYSHYGSRGIIMSAFFQSRQQGVEAFGETGMGKLWSAANVRVVGSGLSEDFLEFVSTSIGDYDVVSTSRSTQIGGTSTTRSLHRERILDKADLTAMPRARAVMLASQTPPVLLQLDHISQRPYAAAAKASQEYYEARAAKQGKPVRRNAGARVTSRK